MPFGDPFSSLVVLQQSSPGTTKESNSLGGLIGVKEKDWRELRERFEKRHFDDDLKPC
jgi:hypothetical protein